MTSDSSNYTYFSFPQTPTRKSPSVRRGHQRESRNSASKDATNQISTTVSNQESANMPSPAAGKTQTPVQTPKTPTKLQRKPGQTPSKLGQSAGKATPSTPKAASVKKPETGSPKVPQGADDAAKGAKGKADEATKDIKDVKGKADETAKGAKGKVDETAKGAKGKTGEVASQAKGQVESSLPGDDDDEGPLSKVSQTGKQANEGLEEAAPEPIQDDDDDEDDDEEDEEDDDEIYDTVGGAQDAAEVAAGEAEDIADDATEKAGQVGESADDATDATEEKEQPKSKKGSMLDNAKNLTNKASSLAGKAKEDPKGAVEDTAGDVKDVVENAAEDAQDTAEEGVDEAKKVAGAATDEAGDAADEAGETAEGLKDQAEDTVDDAGETVEDAADESGETVEGVADDIEPPEGLPLDLSVLKGFEVKEDGTVEDAEGNIIGKLAEGDAEDLAGYPIGDDGEILDDDGDLVGRCELVPDEIKKQLAQAKEDGVELPEGADEYLEKLHGTAGEDEDQENEDEYGEDEEEDEGPALPGLHILEGLSCQVDGLIYDDEGNTVGRVVEGDAENLKDAKLNDQGEFIDEEGNVIGRAEIHDDAADLVEQGIYEAAPTGDVEDAVDGLGEDAEDAVEDAEGEVEGIEDELPGIEALEGKELNEAGEIVDEEGNVLGGIEDEELRQQIADGEIDPATLQINEDGEVVDEEGNVLGKTELAEGAAQKLAEASGAPTTDIRILEGKKVNKKGKIFDEEGEEIGKLVEGEISQCAGKKVNEKGEVLDKKGNVIGHVEITPGEAAETATRELLEELGELEPEVAEEEVQLPGLDILEGLKVNKKGQILNEDGEPIGELIEGEIADCAGKKVNDQGEVLDKDGNVIGRVQTLAPQVEEEEEGEELAPEGEEEEEEADQLPPLSVLEGLTVNKAGKLINDKGTIVGELTEGDAKKLSKSGITCDAEGQFWDSKGHVIGRAQTVPVEEGEDEAPFAGLEGLRVVEGGFVEDENGNRVGYLTEGDAKKLIGREVDEDGDVLDKKGSVVGHADRYEEEEQEEQAEEPVDLSFLKGKTVNKAGYVIGDEDIPVARLVEGKAKDLAGKKLDGEGQFWNDSGEVIGRVELIPEEEREAKPEGPFAGLQGLRVIEGGKIADEDGNVVGEITEGNAKRLIGLQVDEDGDIMDKYGNVKGHAEPLPEEEEEQIDYSILDGLKLNKQGYVVDDKGVPVGRLIEGDVSQLAGRECDEEGYIHNDKGKIAGRAEPIPEEERQTKAEGPFAGLEGLRVVKEGKVEDEDGNVVGEIVEGNPKRLVGLAVDEDGDILDKYGNVKGHAEPIEEEEEEAVDNSILAGKTLNKTGYVVDESGIPFGRLIEGDAKELAGRKCDENGYLYNDTGKVAGKCEAIPEGERVSRGEGPFAGLEGLRVVKGGNVEDGDGNIVGEIVEGNPKRLVGMAVDEDGDILDKYGNVKGHAEPTEEEDEEEQDLSMLAGTTINKHGNAVDGNGQIMGHVVEGDVKNMIGKRVDGKGQIWDNSGNVVGRCDLATGHETTQEGPFAGFEGLKINKDETVTTASGDIIGRIIEGDIKKLMGHTVDEDGDIVDKNGNTIGKAERWEPEEKERKANRMSGMRVNKEGEVRDENGDLVGRLTEGNLGHCVGQEIDDNGNVVDTDGNKIGEVTLLENIIEEEYEGPSEEELEEARKREEETEIAKKMGAICTQTLERVQPVCKQITEHMEKADRTPKDELDEEQLVNDVKPLIEEGGRILQECNGSLRGLDPDGKIAAQAKGRAGTGEATPEEYRLAETLKELTTTVVTTIDGAKKKLNDMPHAKKKLNPLWALMTQPLFQILAAVGLLLAGVLGLVGQLLNALGLGGLVNGLLGGLGIDKLLSSIGLGGNDKKKKKGGSAISNIPLVGGLLSGGK
ncbi:Hypothetical protein R9X50_00172100 [Acrodontium crateriforme]|uniref:DUF6987 domain-containing protein n=1 Tax=Acrodontium crateriforme TaxID=150365 RepID=A0AAQ3M5P1_9PEZI|nr:Hypothetical protein R9X50_00172100 [Acrodontium crateriforme]